MQRAVATTTTTPTKSNTGSVVAKSLLVVDAAVVQNAVASASVASSPAPNVDVVPVQDPGGVDVVASQLKATGPLPSVEEKLKVLDSDWLLWNAPGLRATEISRLLISFRV